MGESIAEEGNSKLEIPESGRNCKGEERPHPFAKCAKGWGTRAGYRGYVWNPQRERTASEGGPYKSEEVIWRSIRRGDGFGGWSWEFRCR